MCVNVCLRVHLDVSTASARPSRPCAFTFYYPLVFLLFVFSTHFFIFMALCIAIGFYIERDREKTKLN